MSRETTEYDEGSLQTTGSPIIVCFVVIVRFVLVMTDEWLWKDSGQLGHDHTETTTTKKNGNDNEQDKNDDDSNQSTTMAIAIVAVIAVPLVATEAPVLWLSSPSSCSFRLPCVANQKP